VHKTLNQDILHINLKFANSYIWTPRTQTRLQLYIFIPIPHSHYNIFSHKWFYKQKERTEF
jgi:hypothetical protein